MKIDKSSSKYNELLESMEKETDPELKKRFESLLLMIEYHNFHRVSRKIDVKKDKIKKWVDIYDKYGLNTLKADFWYNKATFYRGKKQFDKETEVLEKVIDLQPIDCFFGGSGKRYLTFTYLFLGLAYFELKKYDKVPLNLEKFLEEYPQQIGNYTQLSISYRETLNFSKAMYYFKKRLEIVSKIIEEFDKESFGLENWLKEKSKIQKEIEIIKKIKQLKIHKKLKTIDILTEKRRFQEALERLDEIKRIANDFDLKHLFDLIRIKANAIETEKKKEKLEEKLEKDLKIEEKFIQIDDLIEKGQFQGAIDLVNKIRIIANQNKLKNVSLQVKKKLDVIKIEENKIELSLLFNEIKVLTNEGKLAQASQKLKIIENRAKKLNLTQIIKKVENNRIIIIKKTILDLSIKFTRLQVAEISEESHIDQNFIVNTIKDMIKNKEIYAKYFDSTQAVAFDQQSNLKEIDRLMTTYEEWEKKEYDKL